MYRLPETSSGAILTACTLGNSLKVKPICQLSKVKKLCTDCPVENTQWCVQSHIEHQSPSNLILLVRCQCDPLSKGTPSYLDLYPVPQFHDQDNEKY